MATIGRTSPHARWLRADATNAEQRLWYHLRNRQLGGFKFRRQVTIGPYIADFACPELRLIVEADGGQHEELKDAPRSAYLQSLGWTILRFWNHDILQETDAVLETILTACQSRKEGPSPCAKRLVPNEPGFAHPLPPAGEGK